MDCEVKHHMGGEPKHTLWGARWTWNPFLHFFWVQKLWRVNNLSYLFSKMVKYCPWCRHTKRYKSDCGHLEWDHTPPIPKANSYPIFPCPKWVFTGYRYNKTNLMSCTFLKNVYCALLALSCTLNDPLSLGDNRVSQSMLATRTIDQSLI